MQTNRNHSAVSALTGYIFQYELANMMKEHLDFSNVVMESQVHGDYGVDITAEYRGKKVLIECKVSPIFSMNRLEQVLKQLSVYKSSKYKIVLAFPGELSSKQKSKLSEQDWLTVWDIDELSKIFHSQIRRSQSEELKDYSKKMSYLALQKKMNY
mgnify:CR=1 FL=1